MMRTIFNLLIFSLYISVLNPSCFTSANNITETILRDIRTAFQLITNSSNILKNIIPYMYSLPTPSSHSTFIFEVPHNNSNNNSEQRNNLLLMQRNELADPKFPNLSTEYMNNMKMKWQRMVTDGSTNFDFLQSYPSIEATTKNQEDRNYMDLSWKQIATLVDTTFTTDQKEISSNIYIARVNDPFGYSTKWDLRNVTQRNVGILKRFKNEDRYKRGVAKLYSMIKCSTGCNPLAYKAYGCYCGFLGTGNPVNGIDSCCRTHDRCYENSNCISYLEYFVPYVWKCYFGKPLCAIDHGEFGGPQSCAARLCQCDLRLSQCLRKYTCPNKKAICTSSAARKLQNLLLL